MSTATTARQKIIDCDVHNIPARPGELLPYLPDFYRKYGIRVLNRNEYAHPDGALRADAAPADGTPTGSSYEKLREQLLDAYNVDYAVLTGELPSIGVLPDPDYAAALASAYNDWVIEHWLAKDERLLGSIRIAAQDPKKAAAEIRRVGSHPQMVQVYMVSATQLPLGHRYHLPIFEAADELGLPIALHPAFDGIGIAHAQTGSGHPSSYFEWHVNWSLGLFTQVVSLITEGILDRFPELKIVCLEGGVSWVPHLMWRLDKDWKGLRSSYPRVKRLPSEQIIAQVRFSTQPVDEPPDPADYLHILRMIHADKTVLFSTDYPHWDFDSPLHALPKMDPILTHRIHYANAAELYGLPE